MIPPMAYPDGPFLGFAADAALPNVLHLPSLGADGPAYPALRQALAARGGEALVLSRQNRPVVTREAGIKAE